MEEGNPLAKVALGAMSENPEEAKALGEEAVLAECQEGNYLIGAYYADENCKDHDPELAQILGIAIKSPLISRIQKVRPTPLVQSGEVFPTNLVAAIAFSMPLSKLLKKKRFIYDILLSGLLILCIIYILKGGYSPFIYFSF